MCQTVGCGVSPKTHSHFGSQRGVSGGGGSAQHLAHLGGEDLDGEWLVQQNSTRLQDAARGQGIRVAGDIDNLHLWADMKELFRQSRAGKRVHGDVGYEHVNLAGMGLGQGQGFRASSRREHAISKLAEKIYHNVAERIFVVHQENGFSATMIRQRGDHPVTAARAGLQSNGVKL